MLMEDGQELPQTEEANSPEAAQIAELEAQLAQARQEATENWNKFLRERADMDNFRKRQERVIKIACNTRRRHCCKKCWV